MIVARIVRWMTSSRDRISRADVGWPRSAAFTVLATRDDVHAGDPAEPRRFTASAASAAESVLRQAADQDWLPCLSESVVAWSIMSNGALAVVEHDCRRGGLPLALRPLASLDERMRVADWCDGELSLRFRYHPHSDAQTLHEELSEAPLAASRGGGYA